MSGDPMSPLDYLMIYNKLYVYWVSTACLLTEK